MTFDNPLLRRFAMIWAAAAVFQIPVVMLISPTGSLPLDVLKAIGFGLGLALPGGVVLWIGRRREDGAVMPAFILVEPVTTSGPTRMVMQRSQVSLSSAGGSLQDRKMV